MSGEWKSYDVGDGVYRVRVNEGKQMAIISQTGGDFYRTGNKMPDGSEEKLAVYEPFLKLKFDKCWRCSKAVMFENVSGCLPRTVMYVERKIQTWQLTDNENVVKYASTALTTNRYAYLLDPTNPMRIPNELLKSADNQDPFKYYNDVLRNSPTAKSLITKFTKQPSSIF